MTPRGRSRIARAVLRDSAARPVIGVGSDGSRSEGCAHDVFDALMRVCFADGVQHPLGLGRLEAERTQRFVGFAERTGSS